ncbi:MAG: hypothetical protein IT384_15020 [Deltaproteobacteria bacterium]|nr:hypothetical protein [Deltaproteobacteria bacterium]
MLAVSAVALAVTATSAVSAGARPEGAADHPRSAILAIAFEAEPVLLDYGLPHHPNSVGTTHLGTIGRLSLIHQPSALVRLELGVAGRLPMSSDFEEELGALPIARVEVRPLPSLRLTLGSLHPEHGYHLALLDERRERYGRAISDSYDRTLVPEARRRLDEGPAMPGEHGVQLTSVLGPLKSEAFLDWQLLETREHREKFAFGALLALAFRRAELGAQLYLVHYGGERYTKDDPVRFAGLDPKRQPISLGVTARLRPLDGEVIAVDLCGALLGGRMIQVAGAAAEWFSGGEIGVEATLFEQGRVHYHLWLPERGGGGWLSEEGDPIYREGRTHRVGIALTQTFGALSLEGALDLAFPIGGDAVQYQIFTRARWRLEHVLWKED